MVHGRKHVKVLVTEDMVDKLGEFAPTRTFKAQRKGQEVILGFTNGKVQRKTQNAESVLGKCVPADIVRGIRGRALIP